MLIKKHGFQLADLHIVARVAGGLAVEDQVATALLDPPDGDGLFLQWTAVRMDAAGTSA